MPVSPSDTNRASQMPLMPDNSGITTNAGTRNITPRSNENTIEGTTISTLWKYPIAVRLKMKNMNAVENNGIPFIAICAASVWVSRKRPIIVEGNNTNSDVTITPIETADNIAILSVAATRPKAPRP